MRVGVTGVLVGVSVTKGGWNGVSVTVGEGRVDVTVGVWLEVGVGVGVRLGVSEARGVKVGNPVCVGGCAVVGRTAWVALGRMVFVTTGVSSPRRGATITATIPTQ